MKRGTEIDARFFVQYDDDLRAIRDTAFLGKRRSRHDLDAVVTVLARWTGA